MSNKSIEEVAVDLFKVVYPTGIFQLLNSVEREGWFKLAKYGQEIYNVGYHNGVTDTLNNPFIKKINYDRPRTIPSSRKI